MTGEPVKRSSNNNTIIYHNFIFLSSNLYNLLNIRLILNKKLEIFILDFCNNQ